MISHWFGWIAFGIGITEFFGYAARKWHITKWNHFRGKHHMAWGKIMIGIALLHGCLTGALRTLNLGTICWLGMLLLWGTYSFRSTLGSCWLFWHRRISVGVLILGIAHIVMCVIR